MESKPENIRITYRIATIGEIIGLRDRVIIRGTDRSSPGFPGDEDSDTYHLAALREGSVIGCLSLMTVHQDNQSAFQLRGMAVEPFYQGQGIGRSLLAFTEKWVVKHTPVRLMWCNARTTAKGFYTKRGWKPVSEEFSIPGVGPHYRLIRNLDD